MGNDQIESEENSHEAPADDQEEERGEIALRQVFGKDIIKVKTEPERRALKYQRAGTNVEASGQPRLQGREMQGTAVNGCMTSDGSSELGEIFFL